MSGRPDGDRAAAALVMSAGTATATFPGTNPQWRNRVRARKLDADERHSSVVGPDGQDPHEIAPGPGVGDVVPAPSFSADGERIVFAFYAAGDDDIFAMDANGANQVQLTDNAVEDAFPGFSPDGQKIVFATRVGAGDLEIALMDADGRTSSR